MQHRPRAHRSRNQFRSRHIRFQSSLTYGEFHLLIPEPEPTLVHREMFEPRTIQEMMADEQRERRPTLLNAAE